MESYTGYGGARQEEMHGLAQELALATTRLEEGRSEASNTPQSIQDQWTDLVMHWIMRAPTIDDVFKRCDTTSAKYEDGSEEESTPPPPALVETTKLRG